MRPNNPDRIAHAVDFAHGKHKNRSGWKDSVSTAIHPGIYNPVGFCSGNLLLVRRAGSQGVFDQEAADASRPRVGLARGAQIASGGHVKTGTKKL